MSFDRRELFTHPVENYARALQSYIDRFMSRDYRPKSYEWAFAKRAAESLRLYDNAKYPRNDEHRDIDYIRKAAIAVRTSYAQLRNKSLI